ncbi:BppU family phage baseplate upper protein [Enterococcus pseudoavium]|uniref:BppU family phage baseplate upper protein n=1 Tax=Enterococcus pseudoavium TaxID=44007 RepID=A0AAE4L3L8_9ENTE|nr:BppU family phage baseplate upper protein [Enterococcus pseudoavium]MDT2738063.1 BppU family phage baseplate upper protein [Enterococcus pseudoavium]
MTNKILNLDISKEPKLNPIIYGRVGDGGSQRVTLNTSKRDEQLDLTGYTITFEGVTSGGKTKVFDSDNVVVTSEGLKKGTFDYVFPNMAFAVKGKYERAYFSFIKDGIRDTSGEIEIIVLDNADIDAAEAETIITEYNKLVTELRKLQDQAIADMNQNFAATQAKISELEKQLSDTQSELQQALKDFENGNFWKKEESFNKEQSSANVIDQIDSRNFVDAWKMADGTVTNVYPNENLIVLSQLETGDYDQATGLPVPSGSDLKRNTIPIEVEQNVRYVVSNSKAIKSMRFFFYGDNGTYLGTNNTEVSPHTIVMPENTKLMNYIVWNGVQTSGSYVWWKLEKGTQTIYTPAPTDDLLNAYPMYKGQRLADSNNPDDYDWSYSDEYVDYAIAQNHVTNLATTEEAKAGTNTTKTMTPATTAQSIDNRAVTLASNQTIGGIKNFQDGLMVGGDLAVSKNDHSVFILNASNCDKIIDGAATFIKHGALVIALGTFKFKTAAAFGTVISSALPAELSATIVNGIVTGNGSNDTAKAMYSEKGTTNLRANSNFVINEWFTFGGVYWAGKE